MPERYDAPMSLPCRFFVVGSWIWKKNSSSSRYDSFARIEDDLDRLGMRAVIAVRRMRHVAAAVADARRHDAGQLADQVLHAPEAAARENRRFRFHCHDLRVSFPNSIS